MTRGLSKLTLVTAISSTRCAIPSCRRRGLRISGETDITADTSRRNFRPQPQGGTNARQTCALANRLGYRRGVLSEESRLHRRWRPPSPRPTSFASRTNWSPFPPVLRCRSATAVSGFARPAASITLGRTGCLGALWAGKSRHLSRANCQTCSVLEEARERPLASPPNNGRAT